MVIKACKICDKPINESEKWRHGTCRKCYNETRKKYDKRYRDNHKEYYKEYRKSHEEELKEYHKEYNKEYYESHREELKEYSKQCYNQSKSNYIYVIVHNNEVVYVGSTTNINSRISNHINGHSNVNENWNYIYYLNVTSMLKDEITLQLLEQLLFDHFKPEFNIRNPVDKTNIAVSKQKMDLVLQQLLNSKEWQMYNKVHEVLRAIGGDKSI